MSRFSPAARAQQIASAFPPPETRRHLQSDHPTRALCGASIAWSNITVLAHLATCPVCLAATRRRPPARALGRKVAGAVLAVTALSGCALTGPIAQIDRATSSDSAATDAPPVPHARPTADVVAFCGPSTRSPWWRQQLAALADIGVTAFHGYCYTPPADYSVLHAGTRYASQAEQLELATEARRHGLGIIAYDPQFWTDPPAAAQAWASFIADGTLVAVDLGDEPSFADMPELNRRADLVRSAGVVPQVVFVGSSVASVLDQHAALPTACPTSDDYGTNAGAMADAFALRLAAGCAGIAIDTTGRDLDGDGDQWSVGQLTRARAAGFRITLFTGVRPENFQTWDPLVDDRGRITPAGAVVKAVLDV